MKHEESRPARVGVLIGKSIVVFLFATFIGGCGTQTIEESVFRATMATASSGDQMPSIPGPATAANDIAKLVIQTLTPSPHQQTLRITINGKTLYQPEGGPFEMFLPGGAAVGIPAGTYEIGIHGSDGALVARLPTQVFPSQSSSYLILHHVRNEPWARIFRVDNELTEPPTDKQWARVVNLSATRKTFDLVQFYDDAGAAIDATGRRVDPDVPPVFTIEDLGYGDVWEGTLPQSVSAMYVPAMASEHGRLSEWIRRTASPLWSFFVVATERVTNPPGCDPGAPCTAYDEDGFCRDACDATQQTYMDEYHPCVRTGISPLTILASMDSNPDVDCE